MAQNAPKPFPILRNAVGSLLRAAREAEGLSQADVVAKLQIYGWDLGRTGWTKIELGERMVSDCELIAIADVLGIGLDALAKKASRTTVRRVLRTLRR